MTNPRHPVNPTLNLFKSRDPEQMKRWLSEGADVNGKNNKGNTPLMNAARKGWEEAVQLLLEAGASVHEVNAKGVGVNIMAARSHSVPCLEMLLAAGMNPLLRDDHDRTALMVATHPDIAVALAKSGVDIHSVDARGKTALHHLAARDDYYPPKSIDTLVALGADLEARDLQGATPLLGCGHSNAFTYLLERGAQANAFDHEENGVLHRIARHRYVIGADVVRLALSKGADPYLSNSEGKLPIDLFQAHLDKLYSLHHAYAAFEENVNLLQCVALARSTMQATGKKQGGPRL